MGRLWHAFVTTFSSFLLALFLAVLVWVVAVNATNKVIDQTFPSVGIPIELENLPPGLVPLSGEGQRVRMDIRAPEESWLRLEPSDFRAWVDLKGLGPGLHQLEVQVEQARPADRQVRILRRLPDRISVRLDEIVTRTVPIDVDVSDRLKVPYSYEVLTPTISPPEVTVRGPRTVLDQIDSAIATVQLHEAHDTVTGSRPVSLINRRGETINPETVPGMRLDPEEVEVTVPIQQRPGYRELIVSPVIVGEPARGYWVSNRRVSPPIISVVGLPAVTENLPSIVQTEPIDVSGEQAGMITRNVRVQLPDNVSPLDQRAVTVTVEIEPQLSSKTVTVRPEITGLQPGLQVSQISPETIDVLIEGPVVELESLEPKDVIASLDLTGKVQGASLITPTIRTPGSLDPRSWLPQQVEVTVTEAQGQRSVVRPVAVTGVAPDLRAAVAPPTITLELVGPLLVLQDLEEAVITPTLDVSGRPRGTYVLTPTISLPTGITLTQVVPPQLTVDLYPPTNTIVVSRTVTWDHLGQGLVLNLEPRQITLQLRGPGNPEALSDNQNLRVTVDLQGLGPGTYTLQPQVVVPAGYELVALIPESVRAKLVRQ
ncbi:MAG: CdaR family protein [Ardenticatenaceae bacterium]|nr:CdaR family protein [Ardenticatenaceae bacterium]